MAHDVWTTTIAVDYSDGRGAADVYGNDVAAVVDPCEIPYMPGRRWYLVAVLGTSLSVVSFVCNVLIARVLLRPKHSHFFFLGLLALSDSFLSFCYGPVIAMDIIKNRLQMLWLTRLWWSYVGPLLAMCHVSMTFSTFMIILGTIERYLITVKSKLLVCFRRNRSNAVVAMLVQALILRGTAIFEIKIMKNANCTGLSEYEPVLTPLVDGWFYETVFRFYFRTIATVFIPFFLLGYLNFRIVDTLRRQKRSAAMFRFATSDHKLKIRSATRLLVLIVCSYLVANFLNVFITAWEYVDLESTQTEFTYDIYETLTDIISMLYILTCALRFPLYILFNQEIRSAFYDFLFRPSMTTVSGSGGVGLSAGGGSSTPLTYYSALASYPTSQQNGRFLYSNRHYYMAHGPPPLHYRNSSAIDSSNGASPQLKTSPDRESPPYSTTGDFCARFRAYCINRFCSCCLEDDKYMYESANSVSDYPAQNRSPSTRRMSLSNCAPIGTDFDRLVVAMAMAQRFTTRHKESINQNARKRGRRCTLPPNIPLNRCQNANGNSEPLDEDEDDEDIGEGPDENSSTGGVYLGDDCGSQSKKRNGGREIAKKGLSETGDHAASNELNNSNPNFGVKSSNSKNTTINEVENGQASSQSDDLPPKVRRPTNLFGNETLSCHGQHFAGVSNGNNSSVVIPLVEPEDDESLLGNTKITIFENPLAKI